MTKEVIGVCTTPARYEVIPIRTKAPTGTVLKMAWKTDPSPAPIDSDGANSPPGMPLTAENSVARNFSGM